MTTDSEFHRLNVQGPPPARTIEQDVDAAVEDMSDGGGTMQEHATLLARQYRITVAEAFHRLTGPCFCCGHGRESHIPGGPHEARACTAELFSINEEVLTDCPCGDFVYWPEGAVRI